MSGSRITTAMAVLISALAFGVSFSSVAQTPMAAQRPEAMSADLERAATAAEAKIGANRAEREGLAGAVRSKNEAQAREILRRNGYNVGEGERLVLADKTGGMVGTAARPIRIVIVHACCPPITVIIIFL
jgi:hypothetical protein